MFVRTCARARACVCVFECVCVHGVCMRFGVLCVCQLGAIRIMTG